MSIDTAQVLFLVLVLRHSFLFGAGYQIFRQSKLKILRGANLDSLKVGAFTQFLAIISALLLHFHDRFMSLRLGFISILALVLRSDPVLVIRTRRIIWFKIRLIYHIQWLCLQS